MPDKQPNISSYAPAELMRYATGRMSAAEMHALEKAALEDPFLAEAVDGYMEAIAAQPVATVQAQIDRLTPARQKEKAVVVPLWKRNGVRIAIAAIFVAGAGWAVFSLVQKQTPSPTAIVQQVPVPPQAADDSAPPAMLSQEKAPQLPLSDSSFPSNDLVAKNNTDPNTATASAPGNLAEEKKKEQVNDFTVLAAPSSLQKPATVQNNTPKPTQDGAIASVEAITNQESEKAPLAMRQMKVAEHIFKAQITDARNAPVPYANVMVEGQNFGTYSDVSGHFNFISEDSILNVRVRSVGYANQLLALTSNRTETRIVLQEDHQLTNSLPLSVQSRARQASRLQKSIVERDSIMGTEVSNLHVPHYDLYLLNNNRISPLPTLNRQVQLSFDVSKTGEATNITVVKSSGGKSLDEEAIRLIKEGPKLRVDSAVTNKKKVTVQF